MTDSSANTPLSGGAATGWIEDAIKRIAPATAGMTLQALAALGEQETYSRAQVAYLLRLMLDVGAEVRSAGDAAEMRASWEANFRPALTRAGRIAVRLAAMAEAHEIAFLRRYGQPPGRWDGGTPDEAMAAFMWEADREDWLPAGAHPMERNAG